MSSANTIVHVVPIARCLVSISAVIRKMKGLRADPSNHHLDVLALSHIWYISCTRAMYLSATFFNIAHVHVSYLGTLM